MTAPTSSKAHRKLLIVDDEEYVCNALRRSLQREGYEVDVAHHPAEALQKLLGGPFDLVISDHLMPNMTGLELLKLVRTRHPDCMRLMLTGHADMQTAIDAINHGEIYRFLTKPWDDAELKMTVHLALEQLDLDRENRRLLAMARQHEEMFRSMERQHPGICSIIRDETGAILIDEREDPLAVALVS
ncbi:MAG TPA: response regulator [Myxococcales bacterium]|nr:response regulator [Myxococcales bacterium]